MLKFFKVLTLGSTTQMTSSPVTIKRLPELNDPAAQRSFLREIKEFLESSRRPRLIFDLSSVSQINPGSIDLLLECVDHAERSDGEVFVTGASPETEVLLELTQANSVLNTLPSALEAADGSQPQAA
jgi:anti-anti-sigma regulatory factor